MSIRLPLQTILSYDDVNNVGATSVAGGVAKTFNIPQDSDNVVVKFTASTVGGGASVTFQTSDDGGTTWYDVARTSVVSNANNDIAQWLSIPVLGVGVRSTTQGGTQSVAGGNMAVSILGATGSSAASTIGQLSVSGLPIMGTLNRVFIRYDAAVSANALTKVQVKCNSQSPSGQ